MYICPQLALTFKKMLKETSTQKEMIENYKEQIESCYQKLQLLKGFATQ